MLLYLAGSTCLGISYTVYQCVQFSHNPELSYFIGIKNIARYLKGIRTTGIIIKPDTDQLNLDLYADENFSVLFSSKDTQEPVSVKSRTGLFLDFDDVPIFWSLKL